MPCRACGSHRTRLACLALTCKSPSPLLGALMPHTNNTERSKTAHMEFGMHAHCLLADNFTCCRKTLLPQ